MVTFKGWLKSRNPDDYVGIANSECDCPLARYYRHIYDAEEVLVTHGSIWVYRRTLEPLRISFVGCEYLLEFITLIDSIGTGEPIMAATALNILESVE